MDKDTILDTHAPYIGEPGRDTTISEDDITLHDYEEKDVMDPTKSEGFLHLQKLKKNIENINDAMEKVLHDFDEVIHLLIQIISSHDSHTMIEEVWSRYQNIRVRRDTIIDDTKSKLIKTNAIVIKSFEKRYDEKENDFYKIICQKITDDYHDGTAMKNCMDLDKSKVAFLYKNLVESGRSISKFLRLGDYNTINRCLGIKAPQLSATEYTKRTSSQLFKALTGNTAKLSNYGGKKSTKNKLRKKGRKVTKRRKTVKRKKHSKK